MSSRRAVVAWALVALALVAGAAGAAGCSASGDERRGSMPTFRPAGAVLDLRRAVLDRDVRVTAGQFAQFAIPGDNGSEFAARVRLATALIERLAPILEGGLVTLEEPIVRHHLWPDGSVQFLDATVVWRVRILEPRQPGHQAGQQMRVVSGWIAEGDRWRCSSLILLDDTTEWRLPTRRLAPPPPDWDIALQADTSRDARPPRDTAQ